MNAPVSINTGRVVTLMPDITDPGEIEARERLLTGRDIAQASLARNWNGHSSHLLLTMVEIGGTYGFSREPIDRLKEARAIMLELMRLVARLDTLELVP